MDGSLQLLESLPEALVYLVLSLGAALENIVPPIPADTFIVLGGALAGRGIGAPIPVFLATWSANVASALLVYFIGKRYGRAFFDNGWGRNLLSTGQLERLDRFYGRWGVPAVFLARFLPGFRAVVPVFAGVSGLGFMSVALPVVVASALWYGSLVWAGVSAGRNLGSIVAWVTSINRGLLVLSLIIAAALVVSWRRGRQPREAPVTPPAAGSEPDA